MLALKGPFRRSYRYVKLSIRFLVGFSRNMSKESLSGVLFIIVQL